MHAYPTTTYPTLRLAQEYRAQLVDKRYACPTGSFPITHHPMSVVGSRNRACCPGAKATSVKGNGQKSTPTPFIYTLNRFHNTHLAPVSTPGPQAHMPNYLVHNLCLSLHMAQSTVISPPAISVRFAHSSLTLSVPSSSIRTSVSNASQSAPSAPTHPQRELPNKIVPLRPDPKAYHVAVTRCARLSPVLLVLLYYSPPPTSLFAPIYKVHVPYRFRRSCLSIPCLAAHSNHLPPPGSPALPLPTTGTCQT